MNKENKYLLLFLFPVFLVLILLFNKIGPEIWLYSYVIFFSAFIIFFMMKRKALPSLFWVLIYIFFLSLFYTVPFFINMDAHTVSSQKSVKMSDKECLENSQKYNGKMLSIKGDNINGKIYISGNSKDCRLEAYYLLRFKTKLLENKIDDLPYLYNYTGVIGQSGNLNRDKLRSTGTISTVEGNVDGFPEDITVSSSVSTFYHPNPITGTTPTEEFYSNFSAWYDLSDEGYKSVFKDNRFGIIDLKPYSIKKQENVGYSYSFDSQKAVKDGSIVSEFKYIISE